MKRNCRCGRPLFTWERPFGTCRTCAVSDMQPPIVTTRADGSLFVLPAQLLDRLQALMVGQSPPLKLRMVQQFIVERTDGSRETIER